MDGFAEYDVAILTLEERVEFTPFIQPICLPATDDRDYNHLPVTVVGWGLESSSHLSGRVSTSLKKLHVDQIPLWTCNQKYKEYTETDLK